MIKEDDEAFRNSIEAVLERAKNPKGARNILALLFPKAEKVLKAYVPSDRMDSRDRTRSRRISEREFATTYFGLDPEPLVWSRAEIDEIVGSADPIPMLKNVRRRIELASESERSRLRAMFLESLNGAFEGDHRFSEAWFKALVEISPYFIRARDEESKFFGIDNFQRLRWILRGAFEKLDTEQRFYLFKTAIEDAHDLTLLSDYVRTYTPDLNPSGSKKQIEEGPYFGEHDSEIRSLLLGRIKMLAESGLIWVQADVGRLLWFWWSCDEENEVRQLTDAALDTPSALQALLEAPLSLIRSSEGNYEQVSRYWSSIVDLDKLADRARALQLGADPEGAKLATRFLSALERGKNDRF